MNKIVKIPIIVGFDQREAISYHVFCQSVLEKSTLPIQFTPLAENTLSFYEEEHPDGSNKFIYTRFLTPFLMQYSGWAIYADGDMVCMADIAELWRMRDHTKAVQVVKHEYQTKMTSKYLNNINENYPKKNWSSLVLWNCEHEANRILTPQYVSKKTGKFLHRFSWLDDYLIGEIPKEWNWLAIEYEENVNAKIIHYTLGTPCFADFFDCSLSNMWHMEYKKLNEGMNS